MNNRTGIRQTAAAVACGLMLGCSVARATDSQLGLNFDPDGTGIIENSLVRLRVTNRPGRHEGIRGWEFKPTGYDMVDVLYRQLDAGGGHLLGLLWDSTNVGTIAGGGPQYGDLFVPDVAEASADGRYAVLRQSAVGPYRLTRTLVLRRDHAVIEARFDLENRDAVPSGFALRLHDVQSPGARGQYASRHDRIDLPIAGEIQAWAQDLPLDDFEKRHGSGVALVAGFKSEPRNQWTGRSPDTVATLTRPFAAQVNPENGDGMVFVGGKELLGFYNCPGITLEPVYRPVALGPGETWSTSIFIGAFGGIGSELVRDANPLFVATAPVGFADGRLRGTLSPMFTGRLAVQDAAGKTLMDYPAEIMHPVAVDAAADAGWQLVALDRAGAEIGRVAADGSVSLFAPEIREPDRRRPAVEGDLYTDPGQEAVIRAMLASRKFVIQCDDTTSEPVRELAEKIALHLGVGIARTPRYRGPMISFGSPARSATVRNIGLLKHSVDGDWPGADRGTILHYDNYEATASPVLLVAGSDPNGALVAARAFHEKYVRSEPSASGFDLWVKPLAEKGMAWSRPRTSETAPAAVIDSARGEYECAQVMLTAYEPLGKITAELAPLRHAETGAEISKAFISPGRRHHGPILLRWAEPFPLQSEDGWPGVPDALLERTPATIPAGDSQVLWITTMVSEQATPGRYHSELRVTANGITKSIPIELTVHDFTLPTMGLRGLPYCQMHLMAYPDGHLRHFHVDRLVRVLVEHRQTILELNEPGMFRYHFSPDGDFKGVEGDGLIASDDGRVLLDATRFDWLVDRSDLAAKPFELEFRVHVLSVLGWPDMLGQFERVFPDRFAALPRRKGHECQGHHAQEMLTLFQRHLKRRGLLSRVSVQVFDEPAGFDEWLDNFTLGVREAGLGFHCAFNSIDWKQAERGLGTRWDLINPLYQRFDADFARRAQKLGHRIGWYNCGPPPVHNTGASPSELRSYYWQAAKHDLDFVARWGIQCWGIEGTTPENVWTFPYAHHHSVLYPEHPRKPHFSVEGRGLVDVAPIESIRFNLIRDGMEDAEYVRLLRGLIDRARESGLEGKAAAADELLQTTWKEHFPTLYEYRPAYGKLMQRRQQIAEAIVDLQSAVKTTVEKK